MGGQGNLVLIGGEAGIGKTTLAEAICREATQRGALVLTGRCFDLAETPPYGPWLYLFERYPAGGALPALPAVFAEPGRIGDITSQAALFRQVLDFIKAVTAIRPLVLLLDDYHWADPASLDLLRYLTQSIATLPVVMLVTYRSDELTRRHPLYHLLPLLVREAGAARLDLRRLDDDAVRALVTERYGLAEADAARLAAYLQSRAEGNALFLGELLRSLEEASVLRQEGDAWVVGELTQSAVPPLLRQVIDGRLARLDDESQRLLAVAAIIGHEVPLAVWATVGEVDEDALLDVVEQGIEARLLIELPDGEQVRFAHALIRESLYEGIPGIRRRRVHRRVGEVLAAQSRPDPDAVAYHFGRSQDGREVEWLISAGERAQAAQALYTAAARFEAALALIPDERQAERGWLLFRIARLRVNSASVTYCEEALRLGETIGDKALLAVTRYTYGYLLCRLEQGWRGYEHLLTGAEAIEALSPDERARLHAVPGLLAFEREMPRGMAMLWAGLTGRFARVLALANEWFLPMISDPAADPESPRWANGWAGLAYAHGALGHLAEAQRASAHALAGYRREGLFTNVVVFAATIIDYLTLPYGADDITGRERLLTDATEAASRIETENRILPFPALVVRLRFLEGRWDDPSFANEYIAPFNLIVTTAPLHRARGERETAWLLLRPLLETAEMYGPGGMRYLVATTCQRMAATLALDESDLLTARTWLETHDHWLAWSGAALGQSEGQALWARYHRQSGDMAQAREHAERALAHATEPRQPLALLAAHRLRGELDTDAGRFDDAATHLNASLALADACEAPYERALTLLAMAELRAATGETSVAHTLVDAVRAICTPLGAQPALARADALAARLAQ